MRCSSCGYAGHVSEFLKEETRALRFRVFGIIPIPMSYRATYLICPKCGKLLGARCYKPSKKLYQLLRLHKPRNS